MQKFVVRGGRRLAGSVRIESAKNAVLPMMAAAILSHEEVVITDCPKIRDVLSLVEILDKLGAKAEFSEHDLYISCRNIENFKIPEHLMKELRSSVFIVGALLGRTGQAEFTYPGGCDIGDRPINYHLDGLKRIGYSVEYGDDGIKVKGKCTGGVVELPFRSVGATENLILASVISDGITVIKNVAREPEITDLISMLNLMGAKVTGAGEDVIRIEGVKKLGGVKYKPIPDRIETGTFIIGAMITGGKIEITNANVQNISLVINKFKNNTCKIDYINGIITVNGKERILPFDLATGPYPEFPTDMQPQFMSLLSVASGISHVTENVFKRRFRHVESLNKMGAVISVEKNVAKIYGVRRLHGASVAATDLRGGAGICLAALSAEGDSHIYGVEHIDRGYFAFDGKLKSLGADIERIF